MAKKPVCVSCGAYTDCYCPDCRSENYEKRLEKIERLLEIVIDNQHRLPHRYSLRLAEEADEGK